MSMKPSARGFVSLALLSLACSSLWINPPSARAQSAEERKKRAEALIEKKDYKGAIQEYREALRKYPKDADLHIGLAKSLSWMMEADAAIAEAREAVRLKPDYAPAHAALGLCLADAGFVDEPIEPLREAIRLKPDYAGAHYLLGSFLLEKMTWAVPSRLCARPLALTPPPRRRNTNWAGRSIDRETWRGPLAPTAKPYG